MQILTCPKCGSKYERHPLNPDAQGLCPACRNSASWDEINNLLAEVSGKVSEITAKIADMEQQVLMEESALAVASSRYFGRSVFGGASRIPQEMPEERASENGWVSRRFVSPLEPAQETAKPAAPLATEEQTPVYGNIPSQASAGDSGFRASLEAGARLASLQGSIVETARSYSQPQPSVASPLPVFASFARSGGASGAAPAQISSSSGSAGASATGIGLALAVEQKKAEQPAMAQPMLNFSMSIPVSAPSAGSGAMIQAPDECG